MTKQQVQYLLGTPMLRDPFHTDRWDYVYTFTPGGKPMRKHHLTLQFENDTLVIIDKNALKQALMDAKPSTAPAN
jgi:outer membrane protein assembly factor BamE